MSRFFMVHCVNKETTYLLTYLLTYLEGLYFASNYPGTVAQPEIIDRGGA